MSPISGQGSTNLERLSVDNFVIRTVDQKKQTVNIVWKNSEGIVSEHTFTYKGIKDSNQTDDSHSQRGEVIGKILRKFEQRGEKIVNEDKLRCMMKDRFNENFVSRIVKNIWFRLFGSPRPDKITTALNEIQKEYHNKSNPSKNFNFILGILNNTEEKIDKKNRDEILWCLAGMAAENPDKMRHVLDNILDKLQINENNREFVTQLSNTNRCNTSNSLASTILTYRSNPLSDKEFSDAELTTIMKKAELNIKENPSLKNDFIHKELFPYLLNVYNFKKYEGTHLYDQLWKKFQDNPSIKHKFLQWTPTEFKDQWPRMAAEIDSEKLLDEGDSFLLQEAPWFKNNQN
jgi:hypothetical protein